jgi:hypothetical protein
MRKFILYCLLGLAAELEWSQAATAQVPPVASPYYIPQGPQAGTYGFPLYFSYPGSMQGIVMTYNFGPGRVREFNYGMSLPNGVSFSRGLGGGSSGFAPGASSSYVKSMPPGGGGNIFAPFYAGPSYYLPTY